MNTPNTESKKVQLIQSLHGVKSAMLYGLVLDRSAENRELSAEIDGKSFGLENDAGTLKLAGLNQLAAHLRDETWRHNIRINFRWILLFSLVKLTHELVLMYCRETEQTETYRSASFYQYACVVRNLLSHNDGVQLGEWPDRLRKKGVLEVSWNGRTISASDVRREVVLSPADHYALHDAILAFAIEELL